MFKDKNILVTGGTGMIGRELVQILLDKGAKIRVASLDEPVDFFENVEFHKVDLTIYKNCEMVCEGMDFIFHVAGIKCSAEMPRIKPLNYFIPMIRFNTNMMEAAYQSGTNWFLYTSSVGVYSPAEIMKEDEVWKTFPSDNDKLPGWSKRMGELQAEGYKIQYDWDNISIVRPANTYGRWDEFDAETAMVIPSLIRKAEEAGEGGTLSVWGDGTPIRDFVHARDVARGMIFAVENKITEPLNLASGEGVSIAKLASSIAAYFKCGIEFDKSKPNGDHKRILDMSRAYSYGFKNTVDIDDGIDDTISWYLENKNKKENLSFRYNSFKV
jgi:GDP-L-fucose synthase